MLVFIYAIIAPTALAIGYVGQIHPALKIEMFLQRRNC
jgi:hypothetical protein